MNALPTTIRADDLSLLLAAHKLRRWTNGRTCQLCALTEYPVIQFDCHERMRNSARYREAARRHGLSQARVWPMARGYIGRVYEQVQRRFGRREVLRTWGAGLRVLQSKPQHTLNGGAA